MLKIKVHISVKINKDLILVDGYELVGNEQIDVDDPFYNILLFQKIDTTWINNWGKPCNPDFPSPPRKELRYDSN